ncbi:MAG: VWA domain-containing protein [Anaerolineae bacterium]|nr:VWA domain-containing protein [Anaerolineae bacterium]
MMKRTFTALVLMCVLVAGAAPALAHDAAPNTITVPLFQRSGVIIDLHRVHVKIDNQVATTRIEQVFYNDSNSIAEGTYIFPLPVGAAVSDLVMWVDGRPIEAKILDADEARQIYDEIVRQIRDPALLEYVGAGAIQASVFPIQPQSEVKIEIEYGQLLPVENGLVHYEYPLRTDQFTRRPVESLSISVEVESNDEISAIYSPTHPIAISRQGKYAFKAGYEASYTRPDTDFSLYYGLASDEINANLLTYREGAQEDGFFTLMITPPVEADEDRVIPKDVIIVLDQSGSMYGDKWDQAREAVKFVLDNLNRRDRFNVVVFSTGYNLYALDLQPVSEVERAQDWVDNLEALGGTDIDAALHEAMKMSDRERSTVVLFLTDGLPTEGETDASAILDNVESMAPPNVRIFTFGVGDDVDTFLLDQLNQKFRGVGVYVRPDERIDEEVSSLYGKISSPVMTNITLDFDGMMIYDMYPETPLPDLFAGNQIIIVGRYRDSGSATVKLTGELEGEEHTYRYRMDFPSNAGGQVFIPRLWATRKIGALLNAIRLYGEDPELVDSIVRLSIRYGIITPYTSFLIEEQDIFTQSGVEEASAVFEGETNEAFASVSGEAAVGAADYSSSLQDAEAPAVAMSPTSLPTATSADVGQSHNGEREKTDGDDEAGGGGYYDAPMEQGAQPVQYAGDRTFVWRDDMWIDTLYNPDTMTPEEIVFLSDEYFDLLELDPVVGEFLSLGDHVLFVWEDTAYEVVPE